MNIKIGFDEYHRQELTKDFMDLDAEQYDEMIRMAENHGKVFD